MHKEHGLVGALGYPLTVGKSGTSRHAVTEGPNAKRRPRVVVGEESRENPWVERALPGSWWERHGVPIDGMPSARPARPSFLTYRRASSIGGEKSVKRDM
jgi:hypothetical protein